LFLTVPEQESKKSNIIIGSRLIQSQLTHLYPLKTVANKSIPGIILANFQV